MHHIFYETNTPSVHLKAKFIGVSVLHIHTSFTFIYANIACGSSQTAVVRMQDANLLNLAALTWTDNEVQSLVFELLFICINDQQTTKSGEDEIRRWLLFLDNLAFIDLIGFNTENRVYKGKKVGLEKLNGGLPAWGSLRRLHF